MYLKYVCYTMHTNLYDCFSTYMCVYMYIQPAYMILAHLPMSVAKDVVNNVPPTLSVMGKDCATFITNGNHSKVMNTVLNES
jgi:hypothetical protein